VAFHVDSFGASSRGGAATLQACADGVGVSEEELSDADAHGTEGDYGNGGEG